MPLDQPVDPEDGAGDVAPSREAVVEGCEARRVAGGVEALDEGTRGRTQPVQEPLEPRAEERDAAVGEARRHRATISRSRGSR